VLRDFSQEQKPCARTTCRHDETWPAAQCFIDALISKGLPEPDSANHREKTNMKRNIETPIFLSEVLSFHAKLDDDEDHSNSQRHSRLCHVL
jgi:hypothetical protein